MKLTSLLSNLILEETKFDYLYNRYIRNPKPKQPELKFEDFKKLVFADPTTRVPENFDIEGASSDDMKLVKVGNYAEWLITNYLFPKIEDLGLSVNVDENSEEYKEAFDQYQTLYLDDLFQRTRDLNIFKDFKDVLPENKRNITKFTPKELDLILMDAADLINAKKQEKEKKLEKKEAKKTRKGFEHKGGKIIHSGPNWTVIEISDKGPVGQDAAQWFGGFNEPTLGESKWCTSSRGTNHFYDYIAKDNLYVIFPNDDKGEVGQLTGLPKERYQIFFGGGSKAEFKDRLNHSFDFTGEMISGRMTELKNFLKIPF